MKINDVNIRRPIVPSPSVLVPLCIVAIRAATNHPTIQTSNIQHLNHGLKSVATKCHVPTELASPHHPASDHSKHSEPLGSVDFVAPDFNPVLDNQPTNHSTFTIQPLINLTIQPFKPSNIHPTSKPFNNYHPTIQPSNIQTTD